MILVGLIFLSFLSYKYLIKSSDQTQDQNSKIVEVEKVQLKTIKEMADFIGVIKSEQQAILSAKAKGTLNIIAKPGQRLTQGELIAKIENNDIEHNYKLLKEAEEIAKLQFERSKSLLKSRFSSKNRPAA